MKETPSLSPLLFGKRMPVAPAIAAQYVGTETEMDIKLPKVQIDTKLPKANSA